MNTGRTKDVVPLSDRIAKARREERTQQALELARQLAKQEPSDAHRDLVRDVSYERGCQLLKDGKPRDAITVFKNAIQGESPNTFRAQVAAKLAEAGDVAGALELFAALPDSPERAKALTRAVDAALVGNTKNSLPTDLHPAFEAVKNALDLVEKGQDDAAREALQAIGLSSPMLEWKVTIRGLIAYYQNDDARAQDNWQRLDPDRQPWRLVAPYRFQIDRTFRDAQLPVAQERLRVLAARLGGNNIVAALRGLAPAFGPWKEDRLVRMAQRSIRDFAQLYRPSNPAVVARLGQLVAVKIALDGSPQDVEFFRQTFTPPADDPKLNRLMAKIGEAVDDMDISVKGWLDYEKDVAAIPERFPGDTNRLARALILEHIVELVEVFDLKRIPTWVPNPADLCRKSAELVPTRVEPHLKLVELLQRGAKKNRDALNAAKELVKKFPDHAPTWELLAETSLSAKQFPSAIEAFRNVIRIDPLRPGIRFALAAVLWAQGMKVSSSKTGAPAKYRPYFEEAIRLDETGLAAKYVTWSIAELARGQKEEAQRLVEKARQRPQDRVAVPMALYVTTLINTKTPKAMKDESKAVWLETLRQPPTQDEIFAALEALTFMGGPQIKGRVAIINALFPKLNDKSLEAYSADQLLRLGQLFLELDHAKSLNQVARHGSARFPNDPWFALLEFDAVDTKRGNIYWIANTMKNLLERARKLAEKLPREAQERIFGEIKDREEELKEIEMRTGAGRSPLDALFGRFMEGFLNDDLEDEDDPF